MKPTFNSCILAARSHVTICDEFCWRMYDTTTLHFWHWRVLFQAVRSGARLDYSRMLLCDKTSPEVGG